MVNAGQAVRLARRSWTRPVIAGIIAGFGLGVLAEAGQVMLGRNFHVVFPGEIYRCAQPDGPTLERTIEQYGIKTVVNLRGCGVPWPWYLAESRVTHRFNVNQEDVSFSASRLPAVREIRRLIDVFDHSEYPILLHCRQGADRTGLAAMVALLLRTGTELGEARRQLGLRYGHVAVDRAAHLDRFCDLYLEWLRRHGFTHTPERFRQWAEHDYCAGACYCRLEPIDVPVRIPVGKPVGMRFRAFNASCEPWHFHADNNAGIHLAFVLKDEADRGVSNGRSGLFEALVPIGASIELTMVVPALKRPGRYRLLVDLVDEQQCWFFQAGSEPLERDVEVYD